MKPFFKTGQILEYEKECAENEKIEILKTYPVGHKYANANSPFYLTKSNQFGEDVFSESALLDGLDLFKNHELLPKEIQEIIEKYGECDTYKDCEKMLAELKPLGYTFEYYLDAIPYDLRKIQ